VAIGDVGRIVGGRYRVDRELGSDRATLSLLVTDLRNGRPCVLRQLAVSTASEAAVRRFDAQVAILARLDHPGLPRFVDGFSEGEGDAAVRAVVTGYHPGESLERLVAKGRALAEPQALLLLRRLVKVLAYLHAFDPPLVHRTIAATGIILGPDGRPCLTDLDYAAAEPALPSEEHAPPGPDELALAAPEVYMGGAVPASDIYALGLAVCRGMTAKDPGVLLRDGARAQLRTALGVSEGFAAVLARMLEPTLEKRYPDVRALDADLARLSGGWAAPAHVPAPARPVDEPPPARPQRSSSSSKALLLALVALALAAVAVFAVRLRTPSAPPASLVAEPAPVQQPAEAPRAVPPSDAAPAGDAAPAPQPAADASAAPAAVAASAPEPAAAAPAAQTPGPASPAAPVPAAAPAPTPTPAPAPAPAPVPVPVPVPASVPAPALPAAGTSPAADTAPAAVEGRLLLDGKPFTSAASAPVFWFRDETTKKEVKPRVDLAAGAFSIRGLAPGKYAMSVRVDFEQRNPKTFPGDLTAWEEFAVETGRAAALEVPLRTVMHLVQPADNGAVMPGWDAPCGTGNVHPGKVVFSWDELGADARYDVTVDRLACGRGYAPAGRVFTRSTTESWVRLDLPPNQEGECYAFKLTANRGGRTIGIMNTHGKTGIGWDYRFSVAR
jgi:serine/threonine-protein kinase